ncbi:MAG: hypothetical protein HDT07_04350 [Bacteroidales bacterium]|nr:hypothetical protein [Bacteroidales bacterium]
MSENIRQTVDRMIGEELLDDAIRYSSEELAAADSIAHKTYAATDDPDERLRAMSRLIEVGVVHADCLFRGGYFADTLTLSVTLLLMASADFSLADKNLGPSAMALCYLALVSLEADSERLSELTSGVSNGDDHVRQTISYLASILYRLYGLFRDDTGIWGIRAYELLKGIMNQGIISAPTINLFGREIDPAAPADVVGDIIGRLRALGFKFGV